MSAARDAKEPTGSTLSRRELMGTAGAVIALSLLPLPASVAAAIANASRDATAERLTDWTIDDMWGVYPRYADAIAYGRPRTDIDVVVDGIDAQFCV